MPVSDDRTPPDDKDPQLRRDYLVFIASQLRDRDASLKKIKEALSDVGASDFDAARAAVENIEEIDRRLMSSRFTRALTNATFSDRFIATVRTVAISPLNYIGPALAFIGFGIVAYLVFTRKLVPAVSRAVEDLGLVATAFASPSTSAPIPLDAKAALIGAIVIFVGVAFLWFVVASTFSKNAKTRDRSWEFVKSAMFFFGGILTGYLGRAL